MQRGAALLGTYCGCAPLAGDTFALAAAAAVVAASAMCAAKQGSSLIKSHLRLL